MSKKDKLDLKTPDAFHTFSDKFFIFVEEHAKTVIFSVLAAVGVSLAYIGYSYVGARKELRASEAMFAPEDALKKAQTKIEEEKAKDATKLAADKKKPAAPKSFSDEYGTLVDHVESAIKDHASTRVALVTAMNLSHFLVQEKQPQRALDVLNAATFRPSSSDILAGFLHMHRGLALIEMGKFKDSAAEYHAVVEAKSLAALHAEALLKLALSQDLAGDIGQARASYEKVTRQFAGSEASISAQQYLRLLDLKGKKG